MAEIRIEQKRRGLGWLWLLLALILVAALAWYFLYPGRASAPATTAQPATGALSRPPSAHTNAVGAARQGGHARDHIGGFYGKAG
jgi:hypothetical protein